MQCSVQCMQCAVQSVQCGWFHATSIARRQRSIAGAGPSVNDDHDVDDVDVNVDGDGDGDDDGNGYFRWSIGVDAALHHKASMIMKMRKRNWPISIRVMKFSTKSKSTLLKSLFGISWWWWWGLQHKQSLRLVARVERPFVPRQVCAHKTLDPSLGRPISYKTLSLPPS